MRKIQIKKIKNNNLTNLYSDNNYKIVKLIFIEILILLILFIFIPKTNMKSYFLDNYIIMKSKINNNIKEKITLLKLMTNNNENEYKKVQECLLNDPDKSYCIYHLISTKDVLNKKRVLIGEKRDGGYLLLDDFNNVHIAYSFGISTNVDFDKALADRGIDIYMYDHTIDSLPFENTKFHWRKIGICGKNRTNVNLKTLEKLIDENGHKTKKNMILKMDIEHWEWESLVDISEETLNQFNNLYYKVLKKLSETHQPFYVRCNNNKGAIVNFGNNSFIKDENIYPMYEFEFSKPTIGKAEMNLNICSYLFFIIFQKNTIIKSINPDTINIIASVHFLFKNLQFIHLIIW